jgi:3-hydroxybutyryl-CoA dehydrogenase
MESKICVCGAGTMGRGIALTIAKAGIQVILYDLNPDVLADASLQIEKELRQDLDRKIVSGAEIENIRQRMIFTNSIADCQADFIIEAIIEKVKAKSELFLQLMAVNPEATIFATNTSSLSVSSIAESSPCPEKIIGLHFFNPATRMRLVEIIRTKYNSDEMLNRVLGFTRQIGKTGVVCRDAPGFIVNHVARPFYLEALRLSEMAITDTSTIDRLMESAGFKMGPFHLMDLIGNDINYTVSCALHEALGKPSRLKPSAVQEAMVKDGKLGKKTGEGFFQYNKPLVE